jgi:hypothetical protein
MKKARIVLDIEEDLKDHFIERLSSIHFKNPTITGVLKIAMYSMLEMHNDELESFLKQGMVSGASYKTYVAMMEMAKEDGIIPKDFPVGNSRILEITRLLSLLRMGECTKEIAKSEFQGLEMTVKAESRQAISELLEQELNESI